jgi:O-antigen/teichoic acid export membrane protein
MPEALESSSGLLRSNAVANVTGRSVSAVLWVFVTPFALSHLGPERFAVWSLFFVFGGYVATLDLGMANIVIRYVALATARDDRRNLLEVFRRSMFLSACLGLAWCLACMIFRGPIMHWLHVPAGLEPEVGRSFFVFAISMFVFSVTSVLLGTLMGFRRLDLSNLCLLSGLVVHALVLIVGLSAGIGLMAAAVAAISGHLVSGTMAALFVRRSLKAVPDRETDVHLSWRELLRFGGAVQGTAACATAQVQVGQVLISHLGQLVWVTPYSLGFRVALTVWSLPVLMQGAVIPAAAHASAEGGMTRLRGIYDWACRWMFALAGFVLAGLWLVAPALITTWLGPHHEDAVAVTRVLAVAFAVATLSGPATAVARGGGWPLLEMLNFAGALLLNVLLSLWAVPRFGPIGAAFAMAVSYGLAGAWLIVTMHRRLQVPTATWLARVALPRLLLPAAAAALLWRLWPGSPPTGKLEALGTVALQGAAFAVLTVVLSWPTGDPAALWARLGAARHAPTAKPIAGVQP